MSAFQYLCDVVLDEGSYHTHHGLRCIALGLIVFKRISNRSELFFKVTEHRPPRKQFEEGASFLAFLANFLVHCFDLIGIGQVREFDAVVQVLDVPNEIQVGYSPIGFVRYGRAACRVSALKWKMKLGKEIINNPQSLKSNEIAEGTFQPLRPLVLDSYHHCEQLGRLALMDGDLVMMAKVVRVRRTKDG
ncbi:tuf [Symbiodinium sp. CCMP2592]|nr:tuf [Symbiodinium sp. CCMP2592]